MTTGDSQDRELEAALAGLAVHDAPAQRVEGIRARCLTVLARRQQREEARRRAIELWRGRLEAAVAAGLGALYLAGAAERALEILR
jgi:hypothetical protein